MRTASRLSLGVVGEAVRDRPRRQRAVVLEPQVPVQARGAVLLDDEARRAFARVPAPGSVFSPALARFGLAGSRRPASPRSRASRGSAALVGHAAAIPGRRRQPLHGDRPHAADPGRDRRHYDVDVRARAATARRRSSSRPEPRRRAGTASDDLRRSSSGAAGDGRRIVTSPRRDRRLQPVAEADVLAVDVDVDEAAQLAVLAVSRSRSSPCCAKSDSSTSPTVAPSTSTVAAPPAASRSCVGSLTVTAIRRAATARLDGRPRTVEARRRSRSVSNVPRTASSVLRPSPVMTSTTRSSGSMSPRSASLASVAVVTPPAVSVKMPVVSASRRMPARISSSVTASIAPPRAARELERVRAVGRVADRQRLGDRVGLDRAADVRARPRTRWRPASSPRPGRRSSSGSSPLDQPELDATPRSPWRSS